MFVKVFNRLEDLEALKPIWEKLKNHPNSDYEIYKAVCATSGGNVQPHVAVLEENKTRCSFLAGRLENTHFAPSIGYLKPVKIPARILAVIYQGIFGKIDQESASHFFEHLWSMLLKGEVDIVTIYNLPESSPLINVLLNRAPILWCEKKLDWSTHWSMKLPSKQGVFLNRLKSKHRSWVRKKERELKLAFPGRVTWRWLNRIDDSDELCSRIEEVASHTYQRGLGAGFTDNALQRQRFSVFSKRGQLRVQLLEVDEKVKAFWIGTLCNDTFYSASTGYDPDLRAYEPGTLVFLKMIEELTKEGARNFDFGLGDASYKKRFGDHSWREATFKIFAPNAKGLFLRAIGMVFHEFDQLGRNLLQKVGMMEKFKTSWRQKLIKT